MDVRTNTRELTKYAEEINCIECVSTNQNRCFSFIGYRMLRNERFLNGIIKQFKLLLLLHSLVRRCCQQRQIRVRSSVFLQ